MRRFTGSYLLFPLLALAAALTLAGCGGGDGGGSDTTVTKVTITPGNVSMDNGQTAAVVVRAENASGTQIFAPFTFTSSSPNVTISNAGLICAGIWDSVTNPVICKTTDANGNPLPVPRTATITATAEGVTSAPITVYVHLHIDTIVLTPSNPACVSQGQTQQFTATAFNGATDITSTVGPFTFTVLDTNVGTNLTADQPAGQPTNQTTVKAKNPGRTSVIAANTTTTSVAATFTTCGPRSIFLHVQNSTDTAFSIASGSTRQLVADVVDTNGTTMTSASLVYSSSSAAATVNSSALVTGAGVGVATITAACTPPTCNTGVNATIYSNPVTATITGTPAVSTVYVTSTGFGTAGCNTGSPASPCTPVLLPIATDTNTVGTAINIPDVGTTKTIPNSMVMSPQGGRLFIGSSNGMTILDTTTNGVTGTVTSTPGRVISVAPNGRLVVISDSANNRVFVYNLDANTFAEISLAGGATAATWTPDSFKVFLVSGTTMIQFATSAIANRTIAMSAAANDVATGAGGQFTFTAGGEASAVAARSTCRTSTSVPSDSAWAPEETIATGSTPDLIEPAASAALVAVEGAAGQINTITPATTTPAAGDCPPGISSTLATADWSGFGVGGFAARQLVVLPDGSKAYVSSDQAVLLGYTLGTNTTFPVAVSGAQLYTGGATLDSSRLYFGGSDNAVHVISTATDTQTTTIPISFGGTTACNNPAICKPDLVVVRPR